MRMRQHVKILERSKLHRKESVSLNVVMKNLPCTEIYSVSYFCFYEVLNMEVHIFQRLFFLQEYQFFPPK